MTFPAWDCRPYDRVSPDAVDRRAPHDDAVAARPDRDQATRRALRADHGRTPRSQRVPAFERVRIARASRPRRATWSIPRSSPAGSRSTAISRTSTVRETGEYAVRGGIIDLYPPGMPAAGPARLLRRYAGIDPHLRSGDAAHHRAAARARPRADDARRSSTSETHHALPPVLYRDRSARPAATTRSTRR